MVPLKLTFRLKTALASSPYPIHLDALLAYAVTARHLAESPNDQTPIREVANSLPLKKKEKDDSWVWKASALLADPEFIGDHFLRMWTRKTDVYDYTQRISNETVRGRRKIKMPLKPFSLKVDTDRGMLKNAFEFYPVREIFQLHAYCVAPDDNAAEEVLTLLHPESGWVTHIGPRGRTDHGRVVDLIAEEDDAANALWSHRILPWEEQGYLSMMAATRPPYWVAENRQQAFCHPNIFL